jgi:hypothetical protein
MNVLPHLSLALVATVVVGGCSMLPMLAPGSDDPPDAAVDDRFPDVIDVQLRSAGERTYDVAVTISSPYDTPERYADGWRVLDPEGNVLGTHMLMHDHANEQPFTRTQRGLQIPEGVTEVTVEGRDQQYGYGGGTLTVDVPA